jgi:hypothetical protein
VIAPWPYWTYIVGLALCAIGVLFLIGMAYVGMVDGDVDEEKFQ